MDLIPLGSTVRCIITGLTGCAIAQVAQINGNIRYDVQPRSEDGKTMPDAWAVDLQSLEIVDAGHSARHKEPRKHNFKTGQKVRDSITGHEGIVTDIATYINGCVFANVVPRKTQGAASFIEGAAPGGTMMPVERLEVVSEIGVAVPAESKPTGGPSLRAARV